MNNTKVAITRAFNYDVAEVYSAVEKGVALLGNLEEIIQPGSKIFVKINHLPPASLAEKGIVTHPIFVEAVLALLARISTDITVGDDIESGPGDGFKVSGFRQMCERIGIRLVNLRETGFSETVCNGHSLKTVYLSKTALNADVIVNLPKLKTHSLCVFTGGVKNMYGTIPGGPRRKFHGEYIKPDDFNQMLVDIFAAVKPQITIMDGIMAMEGEGPAAGTLKRLGVILASYDAVALDAVASTIIGLEPADVLTTRFATERGIGTGNLQNIKVVGSRLEDVIVNNFVHPSSSSRVMMERVPKFLSNFITNQLSIKLRVIKRHCTGCAECKKACPTGAVLMNGETAKINQNKCIECMCCHEVCRYNAIALKRPILGNIIHFISTSFQKRMSKSG